MCQNSRIVRRLVSQRQLF